MRLQSYACWTTQDHPTGHWLFFFFFLKYSGHHGLFQCSPVPGWSKNSPHFSTPSQEPERASKTQGLPAHCVSFPQKAWLWGRYLRPPEAMQTSCSPLVSSMGFRHSLGHHCPQRKVGNHPPVVIMEKLMGESFSLKKTGNLKLSISPLYPPE